MRQENTNAIMYTACKNPIKDWSFVDFEGGGGGGGTNCSWGGGGQTVLGGGEAKGKQYRCPFLEVKAVCMKFVKWESTSHLKPVIQLT